MISHLVCNIIECEKSLENIRYQLNQDSLFSLQPIMSRLDQKNKSFIDTEDLIAFCAENEVECTQIDAYYALKYLDTNKDGIVNFQDLCSQLLPKTNTKQRTITALREPYIVEQKMHLPEQIESGLAVFFGELLIFIKEQQKIKKELKINIYEVLQDIDKENKCRITFQDFQQYFQLSIQDAQYFFIAAQQSTQIPELSYLELMDCLLNFDSSDCLNQMTISNIDKSSPLKLNPLQKLDEGLQQNSPKFQTEKIKQNYQYDEDAATIKMDPKQRKEEIVNELSQFQSLDPLGKFVKNIGLYRYLTKIIMNQKLIEQAQQKLYLRSDFNVKKLFLLFIDDDYCIKRMVRGLKKFQITINSQISNLIMQQYGEDNKMTFEQFQTMLNNSCEDECDFNNSTTNNYIKELFETIIKAEIVIAQFRPTTQFYQYLDPNNQGYFGMNELKEFFWMHQAYPTNQELELIFKRFNRSKGFKGENIVCEQQFTQL